MWSSPLLVLSLPALCLWYWRQGLRSNLNSGDVQIICNNLICKIALFHQLIHLHVIRAEQKIARNKLNGNVYLLLLLLYLCLYLTARVCELRSDILLIWQVTSFSLDVDWEFKPGYLIQNNICCCDVVFNDWWKIFQLFWYLTFCLWRQHCNFDKKVLKMFSILGNENILSPA